MIDLENRPWGNTNRPIVLAAQLRGIPAARSPFDPRLMEFGAGHHRRRLREMATSLTTQSAVAIAKDKQLTIALLRRAGLPTPSGSTCQTAAEAVSIARAIGYPVVVKPVDGSRAHGVTIDARSDDVVTTAFARAVEHSRSQTVLIEPLVPGAPHRLLVIDGGLIGAFRHRPASVTGDGLHTIENLIDLSNQVRRRAPGDLRPRRQIDLDDDLFRLLDYQGLTLDLVPALGQHIIVKPPVAYVGGSTINCRASVHPDTALVAKMAAAVVGLDIAGIDLVTPDITRSIFSVGGAIVEVNSMPALEPHVNPFEGPPDDYGPPIISMLFPTEPGSTREKDPGSPAGARYA